MPRSRISGNTKSQVLTMSCLLWRERITKSKSLRITAGWLRVGTMRGRETRRYRGRINRISTKGRMIYTRRGVEEKNNGKAVFQDDDDTCSPSAGHRRHDTGPSRLAAYTIGGAAAAVMTFSRRYTANHRHHCHLISTALSERTRSARESPPPRPARQSVHSVPRRLPYTEHACSYRSRTHGISSPAYSRAECFPRMNTI